MRPLNHCLKRHMDRRTVDSDAPVWVLFHDVDEYILPVQTNLTVSGALMKHSSTCCAKVSRLRGVVGEGATRARGCFAMGSSGRGPALP